MATLENKVVLVTGGSRGIGLAIARRAARDGAKVALLAKTAEPDPRLPGTVFSAAAEVEAAGGRALPLPTDVRDEEQVLRAVERTVAEFGGIDVVINNASAIFLAGTLATPMKRFDLMFGVNVRATYLTTRTCLPHLLAAANPHVLNLSPPLAMSPRWFKDHVAYTMAKYGMSMCVLGMAEELRPQGVAVNALWPRTAIATAALAMLGGGIRPEHCRRPEIVADAAHAILVRPSRECSGNFFLDEEVLRSEGVHDFAAYAVAPGNPLYPDFFID